MNQSNFWILFLSIFMLKRIIVIKLTIKINIKQISRIMFPISHKLKSPKKRVKIMTTCKLIEILLGFLLK